MNNKGFTLVELVATIALLAVIAIISFVSINEVVNQSRVNDCENLLLNIKSAAKEYTSDNRYNNTFDSDNDKKEIINVNVLISNDYLSGDIVNPFNNDLSVDANSIVVEIILKDNYAAKEVNLYKNSISADNILDCVRSNWISEE